MRQQRLSAGMRALMLRRQGTGVQTGAEGAGRLAWQRALVMWCGKLQSETTRATYTSAVRSFFRTPGAPDLLDIDLDTLEAYSGALRYRAHKDTPPAERLAPSTVNLKLAALRSFLTYCRRHRALSPDLSAEDIRDGLQGIRAHVQRPYQIVEGAELSAMLNAAAADRYAPERAVALVALALGAGLRVAELCALDVGDLASDATGCYVDVRNGKGNKQRQVPISQEVYELVAMYLGATGRAVYRTADRATPLFLSRKQRSGSGRLTTKQAHRVITACAKRAGMDAQGKRITPHSLRHSYAIDLLTGDPEHGRPSAPLPAVSKLLGHSSVAVTGRYLAHFDRKDLGAYAPTLLSRSSGDSTAPMSQGR